MLRFLQVNAAKNIQILDASVAMTRGACVVKNPATGKVSLATADSGFFLVDSPDNSDGANASGVNDKSFEAIAEGAKCLLVPVYVGERYATTELTVGSLKVGDYLAASAGKFVAASATKKSNFIYGGTYSDPTGLTMYIVECVPEATVPNAG